MVNGHASGTCTSTEVINIENFWPQTALVLINQIAKSASVVHNKRCWSKNVSKAAVTEVATPQLVRIPAQVVPGGKHTVVGCHVQS